MPLCFVKNRQAVQIGLEAQRNEVSKQVPVKHSMVETDMETVIEIRPVLSHIAFFTHMNRDDSCDYANK